MATVTIRNYHFPIHFSYKGWSVEITDKTGLFSLKDLKVTVKMTVDYEGISNNIAHAIAKMETLKNMSQHSFMRQCGIDSIKEDSAVFQREYNRIIPLANEFAKSKGHFEYTLAMNGKALDRFFGQNISSTEKVCQKVIENIDKIYGDAQDEFLKTLK